MAAPYDRDFVNRNEHWYKQEQKNLAEARENVGETQIENVKYAKVMNDYLRCTVSYMEELKFPAIMQQQLQRRDLDTVCAFELY